MEVHPDRSSADNGSHLQQQHHVQSPTATPHPPFTSSYLTPLCLSAAASQPLFYLTERNLCRGPLVASTASYRRLNSHNMAAIRPLARTLPRCSLRAPLSLTARRSMASTPDSSHVSEHKVEAPHSPASHEAHDAHEEHYDPPVRLLDQPYLQAVLRSAWS